MSCYTRADGPFEHGTPLVELIQGDWEVFSDKLAEGEGAERLLQAIMEADWDDDEDMFLPNAREYCVSSRWSHETLADIWNEFAEVAKEAPDRPLEFRGAEFDEFLFKEELVGRRERHLPARAILYRAQPGFEVPPGGRPTPFSGSRMAGPPPDKASPGRANAQGRVVLYCADQEATAVAEVRPARGEYVSVATMIATRDLGILDLATEPDWPNPFVDETLRYSLEFAELLVAFGEQLSRPLRLRDDPLDYIPSQKLAEAIEKAGADGIRYPSAMAPGGTNVVLFRPSLVEVGLSRLVEVTDLRVEYREVDGLGGQAVP